MDLPHRTVPDPASTLNFERIRQAVDQLETFVDLPEQDPDPDAPALNTGRVFTKDNGAGKTQLCVRFATGAVQVIATEP